MTSRDKTTDREYPKATQQSTALRLLGERTRMSFFAGTSAAPLTLFLMMLFLSLSLSLSLCFCAFVLRHGSRICLTQTIAAGFASRAHRPLEHCSRICLTQTIAAGFASRAHRQTLRHFGSLVIHFIDGLINRRGKSNGTTWRNTSA